MNINVSEVCYENIDIDVKRLTIYNNMKNGRMRRDRALLYGSGRKATRREQYKRFW